MENQDYNQGKMVSFTAFPLSLCGISLRELKGVEVGMRSNGFFLQSIKSQSVLVEFVSDEIRA